MIDKKIISAYNKTRSPFVDKTICHAPFNSINFEQTGNANACCYNRAHVLGTYPYNSISDMWFGEKANELRGFILNNDLGGGCQLCLKQLNSNNFSNCKAKGYDFYADNLLKSNFQKIIYGKKKVEYPRMMEFELSNTCNLECVMCSGHFSSSILKNREGKPPMKNPYDDTFVKQLEEFIPHLKVARFLGGEPFLIDIYYEIWERILSINPNLKISITTNGSVLNNRTMALLKKLNSGIYISMDSMVKDTYEKIRINAKHETLMKNFEWFYEYTRTKEMGMSFAVCPMTENWHEMPELVEFCNKKQINIYFNTVLQPHKYSLRSYNATELRNVYAQYSSANFRITDNISKENVRHFNDLTNQINTWYTEQEMAEINQEVYNKKFQHYLQKVNNDNGLPGSKSAILKLILNFKKFENLLTKDEYPLTSDFFDPEYVEFFQRQPYEHFSLIADEFDDKTFLLSYLDILQLLSEEKLTKKELSLFNERLKKMYNWTEDPLLKRIVKGIISLLPDELINLIVNTDEPELKNKIISLFRPELELIDYSEKNISDLFESIKVRIVAFVEKNQNFSELEKIEKINKYSAKLNRTLGLLPSGITEKTLKKQLFLPPVTEVIRAIENLPEVTLIEHLKKFALSEN